MRGRLLIVGEALVEIMRPRSGLLLGAPGPFIGPFPSGASAIAADVAARAGAEVALIAAVGDDPFGHLLLTRLSEDCVDTSRVRVVSEATTGVAFVAYEESGGREFVYHAADAAPSRLDPEDLGSAPEEAAWLHVSGSSLVSEAPTRFEHLLEVASLVFPSEGELDTFGTDATSLADAGAVVCETLGREGARLYHNGTVTEIAGLDTEEVDPTGAGDAFSGTFLAAYMQSDDPMLAAQEANVAAAAHVKAQGPMESGS